MGVVGDNCTSLDLSYNELTSITAVKFFENLQELILDNNKLRDLKTLPRILNLTTLSLNNNKVCFTYFINFFIIEKEYFDELKLLLIEDINIG